MYLGIIWSFFKKEFINSPIKGPKLCHNLNTFPSRSHWGSTVELVGFLQPLHCIDLTLLSELDLFPFCRAQQNPPSDGSSVLSPLPLVSC